MVQSLRLEIACSYSVNFIGLTVYLYVFCYNINHLFLCLSVCLSGLVWYVYLSVCLSVFLSVCLPMPIYYLHVCLSVCILSACLSFFCLSVFLPFHLFNHSSIHPFVHSSIHPPMHLCLSSNLCIPLTKCMSD